MGRPSRSRRRGERAIPAKDSSGFYVTRSSMRVSRRVPNRTRLTTLDVIDALRTVVTRECADELTALWCVTATALTTSLLRGGVCNAKPHIVRMFSIGSDTLHRGERLIWRPSELFGLASAQSVGAFDDEADHGLDMP